MGLLDGIIHDVDSSKETNNGSTDTSLWPLSCTRWSSRGRVVVLGDDHSGNNDCRNDQGGLSTRSLQPNRWEGRSDDTDSPHNHYVRYYLSYTQMNFILYPEMRSRFGGTTQSPRTPLYQLSAHSPSWAYSERTEGVLWLSLVVSLLWDVDNWKWFPMVERNKNKLVLHCGSVVGIRPLGSQRANHSNGSNGTFCVLRVQHSLVLSSKVLKPWFSEIVSLFGHRHTRKKMSLAFFYAQSPLWGQLSICSRIWSVEACTTGAWRACCCSLIQS